ncbi:hypothetical protein [Streptomyces sp. NPDC046197]|uniref:hypothetical protein n=1 Tax=Streptomyces sp. NPDC046197 TaxID=3154337 RepID=UPI0033D93ECE
MPLRFGSAGPRSASPEIAEERSSVRPDATAGGCLLLLVLLADATAGLLIVLVLAVRGLSRADAGVGEPAGPLPMDWTPALLFGGLALALGVTGVLLVRSGNRLTGAVQLTLAVAVAGAAVWIWHDARAGAHSTPPPGRLVYAAAPRAPAAPDHTGHPAPSGGRKPSGQR